MTTTNPMPSLADGDSEPMATYETILRQNEQQKAEKRKRSKGTLGRKTVSRLRLVDFICNDKEFQIRPNGLDKARMWQYVNVYRQKREFDTPIKVARLNGKLYLYDGWHRVSALRELRQEFVEAEIRDVKSREEIRWLSGHANLKNPLPLTTDGIKATFKAYMHANMHMSTEIDKETGKPKPKTYQEIAKDLEGVRHYTTLHGWMREFFPHIAHEMAVPARSHKTKLEDKGEKPMLNTERPIDITIDALQAATNLMKTFDPQWQAWHEPNIQAVKTLLGTLQQKREEEEDTNTTPSLDVNRGDTGDGHDDF